MPSRQRPTVQGYSRETYRKASRRRRSAGPFIAGGIVVVACVAVAVCLGIASQNHSSIETQPAMQVSEKEATEPAQTDSSRFVLTLGGSQETYVQKGEDYIESGCHAVDTEEKKDVTSKVTTEGDVDTSKEGDYTVTYTVTNDGATASKERTVHVVDDMKKNTSGISVMMFHYVYTEDDPPDSTDTNYILDTKLEKELKWLQEEGYYYPSYQELRAYIDGDHSLPKKSVVLTFDDGQKGFLKYGIPLLEKYQVPATSFIICNRSKSATNVIKYASEYVTFQSHSYSCHEDGTQNIGRGGRIYDLSKDELVEDQKKAAEVTGTNEAFAYPYGDVSDVAPEALEEAGVLCAFTINYGQVHPGDDPMKLDRVRAFGESSLEGFQAQVKSGA